MTAENKYHHSYYPSTVTDFYWVGTIGPNYANVTDYSGKWLLYVPVINIDESWQTIARETETNLLGTSSKAATARSNPNETNKRVKVICVYTADCRDIEDVRRVLSRLRNLGFTGRLYYKEDAATLAGNYVKGSASLYESLSGTAITQRRDITNPNQ
jgi:hypothetical protein